MHLKCVLFVSYEFNGLANSFGMRIIVETSIDCQKDETRPKLNKNNEEKKKKKRAPNKLTFEERHFPLLERRWCDDRIQGSILEQGFPKLKFCIFSHVNRVNNCFEDHLRS